MKRHLVGTQLMRACAVGAVLILGGCASFSTDGGSERVRQLTAQRLGHPIVARPADAASLEQTVNALLAKTLTADDAVTLALLNNRSLQASYAELGIAEADLVQAGRLPNPTLAFSRVRGEDGASIERKLLMPVIGLLTMPIAAGLEQRRFAQTQLRTAGDAVRIADQTRRAYFNALAAQQIYSYLEQVQTAAEAGAELARRMAAVGNWSPLQLSRELAFHADTVAQLARARQTQTSAHEQLIRLLGLSGAGPKLRLPDRMPDLPVQPRLIGDAEAQAMTNRLDLLMAQQELAGLASSLGLTRATRMLNVLDLSYLNDQEPSGTWSRGYEIELQIPLFDWGEAHVAKAEAMYMQAVHRAAAGAINARSQVRERHALAFGAWELARHYRDQIVPLKKSISDQQMLRYNGMLISVFELLADAREQVMSVNGAIEALRDYWIADSALQAALTGAGDDQPASAQPGAMTPMAGPAPH